MTNRNFKNYFNSKHNHSQTSISFNKKSQQLENNAWCRRYIASVEMWFCRVQTTTATIQVLWKMMRAQYGQEFLFCYYCEKSNENGEKLRCLKCRGGLKRTVHQQYDTWWRAAA